jgi:hypothetical protein
VRDVTRWAQRIKENVLFSNNLFYSPDDLENWETLPSLNTPSFDEKLTGATFQQNSMILFNERPFFISKDGVFVIK